MALKRLTRSDFARMKSGQNRRFHSRYFTLSVALPTNSASTEPKFSCVVSKKVAPRAVDRNRIKRHAREAVRGLLKNGQNGISLVFYAKKEVLKAPYKDVESDIQLLISRL